MESTKNGHAAQDIPAEILAEPRWVALLYEEWAFVALPDAGPRVRLAADPLSTRGP
jgi:hypothetical protein